MIAPSRPPRTPPSGASVGWWSVADSAAHARELVLAAIPDGAEVHIALSETIRELGITDEIDTSGRYDSIRARLGAMDRETQDRETRKLGAAPAILAGAVASYLGYATWAKDGANAS